MLFNKCFDPLAYHSHMLSLSLLTRNLRRHISCLLSIPLHLLLSLPISYPAHIHFTLVLHNHFSCILVFPHFLETLTQLIQLFLYVFAHILILPWLIPHISLIGWPYNGWYLFFLLLLHYEILYFLVGIKLQTGWWIRSNFL